MEMNACDIADVGSQKAFVARQFFETENGLSPGDVVFVNSSPLHTSGRQTSLCHLWPSNDIDLISSIVIDCSMTSDLYIPDSEDKNSTIIPAIKVDLLSVNIQVTFVKHITMNRYHTKANTVSQSLVDRIRKLLAYKPISNGFTYNCLQSKLALYLDISSLEIHFSRKDPISKVEYGLLSDNTQILVTSCTSLELLNQLTSVAPTLPLPSHDLQLSTILAHRHSMAYRGILLSGCSGVGKTALVLRSCVERKAFLLSLHSNEITSSEFGRAECCIDRKIELALLYARHGPVILLIEDIDSIFNIKGTTGGKRKLLAHLCRALDSLTSEISRCDLDLAIIATAQKASEVHESLRNSNRLEKNIHLGLPNASECESLLKYFCGEHFMMTFDLTVTLRQMTNYTPADILKTARFAMKRAIEDNSQNLCVQHLHEAISRVVPTALRLSDILVSNDDAISLEDIGGLDDVKKILKKCIEWPMKHSSSFARLGLKPASGALLYGPPGCAKTALVKAFSRHCGATFLSLNGAQLFSSYVGESEKKIAEAFRQARSSAPSILFIDEIDSVLSKRGKGQTTSGFQDRVLATLLNEMDGLVSTMIDARESTDVPLGVFVVAATNRPNNLDDAILRPGRFDKLIHVPIPDRQARRSIIEVYSKQMNLNSNIIDYIVERSDSYTGADLENLCREAALVALSEKGMDCSRVDKQHFEEALKIGPSLSSKDIINYSTFR